MSVDRGYIMLVVAVRWRRQSQKMNGLMNIRRADSQDAISAARARFFNLWITGSVLSKLDQM